MTLDTSSPRSGAALQHKAGPKERSGHSRQVSPDGLKNGSPQGQIKERRRSGPAAKPEVTLPISVSPRELKGAPYEPGK